MVTDRQWGQANVWVVWWEWCSPGAFRHMQLRFNVLGVLQHMPHTRLTGFVAAYLHHFSCTLCLRILHLIH